MWSGFSSRSDFDFVCSMVDSSFLSSLFDVSIIVEDSLFLVEHFDSTFSLAIEAGLSFQRKDILANIVSLNESFQS